MKQTRFTDEQPNRRPCLVPLHQFELEIAVPVSGPGNHIWLLAPTRSKGPSMTDDRMNLHTFVSRLPMRNFFAK